MRVQPIVTVGTEVLAHLIIDCLQEKKAQGVRLLDLRHIEDASTDFFIVCEGTSNTQVKAMCDFVQDEIKKRTGLRPGHVEGVNNALWVLLDYFDIVVHIFYHETRRFYQLEELWNDAKVTTYEDVN